MNAIIADITAINKDRCNIRNKVLFVLYNY